MRARRAHCLCTLLAMLGLAACQPDADGPGLPAGAPTPARGDVAGAGAPVERVELRDVAERGDGYLVGISYPRSIEAHPGLATLLVAYADDARAELARALDTPEADGGDPTVPGPYDLSLAFTELHASPEVVAVAADGSSYLGGAHGQPLVHRWVWLPGERRLLTAQALVPDRSGWEAIADYVQRALLEAAAARLDTRRADPAMVEEALRSEADMIEAGTAPDPANFDLFEPIPGGGGALAGLRFVFPPYQVGPYAAGTQAVEVPASVLLPHVAPVYRHLFEDAVPTARPSG